MKNIIKRIIVGVGIALILMLIKDHGLILQAQAKAYSVVPNAQKFVRTDGNVYNQDIVQYTLPVYPGVTWHGYVASGSSGQWNYAQYDFNINDNIKGGYYNVDYLFYTNWNGDLIDSFSFAVYHQNKFTTCTSTASNVTGAGSTLAAPKQVLAVKCENVYLNYEESNKFYLNIFLRGSQNWGNTLGVTPVTLNYLPSNGQQETAQAVQEQNEILQDDSVDTDKADSDIASMNNKVASNGSITSLITLPITLYQSILNSASNNCSSFSIGALYGHTLTLPCINLQNLLGSTLFGIIDMLCSGLFILSFRKKMVDIFNHMTSLNDRGNELE